MGITYGDHLIDSGYYDITPEQEREIEAREECARRGINPDEICADGGVEAWMVVHKELAAPPAMVDINRAAASIASMVADWYGSSPLPNARITAEVIAQRLARFVITEKHGECPCRHRGDCDGSCTHPEPSETEPHETEGVGA